MNIAPCRNCSKREYLCHSSCDKYIEYKKQKENVAQKRKEAANANCAIIKSVDRLYKSMKNNNRYARRSSI